VTSEDLKDLGVARVDDRRKLREAIAALREETRAAGVDVLTVSRNLGRANASITLNVHGHTFDRQEDKATAALDAAFGS
jgi:hypothetical protein